MKLNSMPDSEKIAHLQDTVEMLIEYVIHLSSAISSGENHKWIESRLEDLQKDFRNKS
jgi:hypothetical protein